MLDLLRPTFDSDLLGANSRLEFCREELGRKMLRVEIEPGPDAPFRLRLGASMMGSTRLSRVDAEGHRQYRDRRMIADGDDGIGMLIPLRGKLAAGHEGRIQPVTPGEFMLLNSGAAGSVTYCGSDTAMLSIFVPRATLMPLIDGNDAAIGIRFGRRQRHLAMIQAYLRFVASRAEPYSAREQETMGRHIAELVALACGASGETRALAETGSLAAARRAAILAYVDAHFADPAVSVSAAAATLGISVRYVQSILESAGTSFGAEVMHRRLDRAKFMLGSTEHQGLRISDIAFDCGFLDVSYFNRTFRSRFGESPGHFRIGRQ